MNIKCSGLAIFIKDIICNKHINCMKDIYYKRETQKLKSNNFYNTLVFNEILCDFIAFATICHDYVVVSALDSYFGYLEFVPQSNLFFHGGHFNYKGIYRSAAGMENTFKERGGGQNFSTSFWMRFSQAPLCRY